MAGTPEALEKFEAFIDQEMPRRKRKLSDREREALFEKYRAWLETQK